MSGFTAENNVFPDDRVAVVVLTNQDAARASGEIARRISTLLFATVDPPARRQRRNKPEKFSKGCNTGQSIAHCSPTNANSYFNEQALKDFRRRSGPIGDAI